MVLACLALGCIIESTDPAAVSGPTTATGADTGGSSGGGSEAPGTTTAAVDGCDGSIEAVAAQVFEPSCVKPGCHNATAAGGLDLSEADLAARLVGRESGTCPGAILVVAGDPDASFLVQKLGSSPTCGMQMPVGATLPEEDVACIRAWVEDVESTCETCGTGTCVELTHDAAHCGACDTACPPGVACADGSCACPNGLTHCGNACVDTTSNPDHCGDCGNSCPGIQVCLAADCSLSCGDLTNCDGACVDTMTNPLHCGGCGIECLGDETCVDGGCQCDDTPLSYADDVENIFVGTCTGIGCHRTPVPAAGLDLRLGVGYGELVGVASSQCNDGNRVEPGLPTESYLLNKLRGIDMCFGTKMPKVGAGLSNEQLATVSGWICSGAAP